MSDTQRRFYRVNHQSCCAAPQAVGQSTVGKHRGWPIISKAVTSVITQKLNTEPVRYSTPQCPWGALTQILWLFAGQYLSSNVIVRSLTCSQTGTISPVWTHELLMCPHFLHNVFEKSWVVELHITIRPRHREGALSIEMIWNVLRRCWKQSPVFKKWYPKYIHNWI